MYKLTLKFRQCKANLTCKLTMVKALTGLLTFSATSQTELYMYVRVPSFRSPSLSCSFRWARGNGGDQWLETRTII
jgi:hypothetical protein